jgi:hypothetical protein
MKDEYHVRHENDISKFKLFEWLFGSFFIFLFF